MTLIAEATVWAIPIATTVISIATLVYAAIGVRGAADAKHVDHLEAQLQDARTEMAHYERRLTACEDDRKSLRSQLESMTKREAELMRLVVNRELRDSQ